MSDHLLSHSNSFGFEMEIDTAGCRAYDRNYIVGDGEIIVSSIADHAEIIAILNWNPDMENFLLD